MHSSRSLLFLLALLSLPAYGGEPASPPPGAGAPATPAARSPASKKTPVILDTDIGDDIDDTWALALLLRCPELDLRLVVTDYQNTRYRAKVAAKMLEAAGRTDVDVGIGIVQSKADGAQAAWVKDYDLSKYPGKVHEDGVKALIDLILTSPEPPILICIGPVPNIAAALAKEPRIAARTRFVGMHGSLRLGYGGKKEPDPEWNVRADPKACRAALSAPWDITITPLDTCGLVQLDGAKYASVKDSRNPLAKAVLENYRIWCGQSPERADRESSILFDTVAVYLAVSQELCSMEDLGVRVRDDGFTVIDSAAKVLHCAMAWKDLDAFEAFVAKRLADE